jgi:hypothetical protein
MSFLIKIFELPEETREKKKTRRENETVKVILQLIEETLKKKKTGLDLFLI